MADAYAMQITPSSGEHAIRNSNALALLSAKESSFDRLLSLRKSNALPHACWQKSRAEGRRLPPSPLSRCEHVARSESREADSAPEKSTKGRIAMPAVE